jgi:hypothetical protein
LNVAGFFDPLLAWVDHAIAAGFALCRRDVLRESCAICSAD